MADFWTVLCMFNSRFGRGAVRRGVRGRHFRSFPDEFWGPGVPGRNETYICFIIFQKAARTASGMLGAAAQQRVSKARL